MQTSRLALLGLPVLKASFLLLQYSLQRPGRGLCHAPNPCISGTIPLSAPPVELFCLASNFAFQGKYFATAHGSVEPRD